MNKRAQKQRTALLTYDKVISQQHFKTKHAEDAEETKLLLQTLHEHESTKTVNSIINL